MRRAWRNLVRAWRVFRENLHGEIVFRRHRKGRCTWMEEPSHGSFRWRTCEWCGKQEYMADTSARWTPVPPSPVAQRLTAAAAQLRGQGAVGGFDWNACRYEPRSVHHLDGHQIIGYTLDDAQAGDIAYWNAADQIIVTRPEVGAIEATFTVRDEAA